LWVFLALLLRHSDAVIIIVSISVSITGSNVALLECVIKDGFIIVRDWIIGRNGVRDDSCGDAPLADGIGGGTSHGWQCQV